jgi:gamma-glutamylcyclotransferase (GGCT)/AIG2-like uncharacterized protein YtfP
LFSRVLFFIVSGLMVQTEYHTTALVNQSMSGRLLARADFLGEDCLHVITLYDLGPYPGAKAEQSQGIDIEVYAISTAELEQLDLLEDFREDTPDDGEYTRMLIKTAYGPAWIYLYNPDVSDKPVQRRGSWRPLNLTGH